MDRIWLPLALLTVTVLVVAVTFVMRPEQRSLARRGLIYALRVVLIVGLVMTVLATMLGLGLSSMSGQQDLGAPFLFGLIAGGVLGGGYFCLNLIVLEIGLWFRPPEAWAKGAVLATPIVIAALGFGWSVFQAHPT